MKGKQIICLTVFLLSTILVVSVIAIAKVSWTFEMKGEVVEYSLRVTYLNGTELDVLDFGKMEKGNTYTQNITVDNNGTTQLQLHLNLPTNSWTNGTWGLVSWDRVDYILPAAEKVNATITWEIKPTAPTGAISPISVKVEGS